MHLGAFLRPSLLCKTATFACGRTNKRKDGKTVTELESLLERICRKFQIEGEYLRSEQITYGHINTTYRVCFLRNGEEKDYILQKVNTFVFKDPQLVMKNIVAITEHIRAKIKATGRSAKRNVLHFQKTAAGNYFFYTCKQDFWRCSRFIDDSVTYLTAESLSVMEEAGRAYGGFQNSLRDFPVETLHEVIPHFHNTVMRFEALKTAYANDFSGRKEEIEDLYQEFLALENVATKVCKMEQEGLLPLRVTHNDTKSSNVLFDQNTDKHLAVIDLDTVMPGLVAFDFGDAIRGGASTAGEDEPDTTKIRLDVDKFEAFTKGFLSELKESITDEEKQSLALGAIAMTLECGARFLTDFLDGDKYFRVEYPAHNLVRARSQLALAKDMIKNLSILEEIVKKYAY